MPTFRRHPLTRAIVRTLAATPLTLVAAGAAAQDVDLGNLGERGFRLDGVAVNDQSGISVSGAGDVNGDGFGDFIIGANLTDPVSRQAAGESYVVFGRPGNTNIDLGSLGAGGFRLLGGAAYDESGISVSGAGDVNGDGLDDLIVGAHRADPPGASAAGRSFVVFGKTDGAAVDLANLGSGGFAIDGIDIRDYSGISVSSAGDVNGDGRDDLVIGAWLADPGGDAEAGEAYVVFGKADPAPVSLAALGTGGFRIDGIDPGDRTGSGVSGAGDVNGDGLADLVIGAPGAYNGNVYVGETHVVFGMADSTPVDLAALGAGGFRIDGADAFGGAGQRVSGAGDVNGDGLGDLLIGSAAATHTGRANAGRAFVVYGKSGTASLNLGALGAAGIRINGGAAGDFAGSSVAGAGDVNGDGLADVVIGAERASPGGDLRAGQAYVIFGGIPAGTTVDLSTLSAEGFRILGIDPEDFAGTSVSGAGDVNGDGFADVIVGAPRAAPGGRSRAGESYVVFGAPALVTSATYRARSANGNPPRTAVGITGDGSNDGTPDARAWIDFADGADPAAPASTETVTLSRSAGAFPAPGANVSWRIETTRQGWTTANLRLRYADRDLATGEEGALRLFFSPDGQPPYTPLAAVFDPTSNTISTSISQTGHFFIGAVPEIFANGFEPASPPP